MATQDLQDIRLLFMPKTHEYVVVSGEYRLRMSEDEFNCIKGTMNGISLALADKAREKKKATLLPACVPPSLPADPRA